MTALDDSALNEQRIDEILVVRCQLGERAAFDALIQRWSAPLHRYAMKLTGDPDLALDLAQEVWLRVIQGMGRLRDAANFRAWMFGIAHRVFADRLRVRYAIPIDHAAPLEGVADDGLSFEEEELKRALALGVEVLPIVEREVVVLFYFEALSLAEIASALGVPEGTVKSRLFRARNLLRQHFAS